MTAGTRSRSPNAWKAERPRVPPTHEGANGPPPCNPADSGTLMQAALSGLLPRHLVHALDRDQVAVDHVMHPVGADVQPVVVAAVKAVRWRRDGIIGECRDSDAHGVRAVLVAHVLPCGCPCPLPITSKPFRIASFPL